MIFASEFYTAEEIKLNLYHPYQKAQNGNKKVNTGGVLYDKYLSVRKKYLAIGLIPESERTLEGMYIQLF